MNSYRCTQLFTAGCFVMWPPVVAIALRQVHADAVHWMQKHVVWHLLQVCLRYVFIIPFSKKRIMGVGKLLQKQLQKRLQQSTHTHDPPWAFPLRTR